LRRHQYRPDELADLYLTLGRLQGVLAYAALDAGDPTSAMTHADAGWVCAERAGDNELRAWVRGTQSLIARFDGDYDKAMRYLSDGFAYQTPGTGRLRLLCGYAQCHANLGDSRGANEALNQALRERQRLAGTGSPAGIFGFSEAKQHYYAGSSLIWLDGDLEAARAVREAGEAIAIWEREDPGSRPLDDEALAHIYLATAHLQLGRLDAAADAVRPILDLPSERQISWVRRRLGRLGDLLRNGRYAGSHEAMELFDEVRAIAA
jgi:tetratricopeptide (TPR) repeat protein